MREADNNRSQASVLDRLIDLEPDVSREPVQNRLSDYRQLMAVVRRDIENLLNTKNFASVSGSRLGELENSLMTYGLPDFTAQGTNNASVRDRLRRDVETAIRRFEPRLTNVVVRIEQGTQEERNITFRITGLLMTDPAPEPVVFDTHLDINKGEYEVRG